MSPVVFRERGFRFLFYSDEGNPREPMHIHVIKYNVDAKFWLWPQVKLAYNDGHDARTITTLGKLVEERRDQIKEVWNGFFGETG